MFARWPNCGEAWRALESPTDSLMGNDEATWVVSSDDGSRYVFWHMVSCARAKGGPEAIWYGIF